MWQYFSEYCSSLTYKFYWHMFSCSSAYNKYNDPCCCYYSWTYFMFMRILIWQKDPFHGYWLCNIWCLRCSYLWILVQEIHDRWRTLYHWKCTKHYVWSFQLIFSSHSKMRYKAKSNTLRKCTLVQFMILQITLSMMVKDKSLYFYNQIHATLCMVFWEKNILIQWNQSLIKHNHYNDISGYMEYILWIISPILV